MRSDGRAEGGEGDGVGRESGGRARQASIGNSGASVDSRLSASGLQTKVDQNMEFSRRSH